MHGDLGASAKRLPKSGLMAEFLHCHSKWRYLSDISNIENDYKRSLFFVRSTVFVSPTGKWRENCRMNKPWFALGFFPYEDVGTA